MSNGGYILDERGFPKFVGLNVPVWKQEVDSAGNPVGPTGNNGGCIGTLVLLFVLIPVALISSATSLISAPLLKLYIKRGEAEYELLNFREAFKLLFKTTFLYQMLNLVSGLISYWLLKDKMQLFDYNLRAVSQAEIFSKLLIAVIILQIPTALLTAIFLRNKLLYYSMFSGFRGYIRAFLFTGIVITPIICVAGWVVWSAVGFYIYNMPNLIFHR